MSTSHPTSPAQPGPAMSPAAAAWAMVTPTRKTRGAEHARTQWQREQDVKTSEGRIHLAEIGSGPIIALVHGWEGSSEDWGTLAPAAAAQGYTALAMDLPAHGQSEGSWTSILASAHALRDVQMALDRPFHAVVGHSLGCAVAGEALLAGLAAERAVLIAPPRRYIDGVRALALQLGFNDAQTAELVTALRDIGVDPDLLDLPRTAASMSIPALILHSDDDRVIPLKAARSVADAWPGSRFVELSGLGHRRILGDARVAATVCDFLGSVAPALA